MPNRRRPSTFRLLRAVWRYRGRIEAHGGAYQAELATAVRTALHGRALGRSALTGYRLLLRALVFGAVALIALAALLAWLLWKVDPLLALLALPFVIAGCALGWWRIVWGAPLDWLDEHADADRTVSLAEMPGRLRTLAGETRKMANVPAQLAEELDALAGTTGNEIDGRSDGDQTS